MAQIVVMPALGNTVESCLLSGWLVAVGDTVDANTTLCEIETDKSTMDVPTGVAGTVLALLGEEGDDIPVKTPIAVIGDEGENPEAALAEAGLAPQTTGEGGEVDESTEDDLTPPADEEEEPESAASVPAVTGEGGEVDETTEDALTPRADGAPTAVSPRARGRAAAEGLPLDAVASGTGPQGRVIERDIIAAAAAGPRPTRGAAGASAAELSGKQGTGLGGRVTRDDLTRTEAAEPVLDADTAGPRQESRRSSADGAFPGEFADTALKGIRKLIAERMLNALAVSAQLSYDASADAAGLLALRKKFKNSPADLGYSGITLGDMVCFATVQVLRRHANLNAHLLDSGLRTFDSVHLGLAVDTPRGLLVPTIRNADRLSIRELSDTTKELAEQARSGKIDPELLSGATFTVSNLGSFGIESFTPIINVPQTGILGVNTITKHPVLNDDGTVGVQQRMSFSLTADHQVVDGADAGRFLADLAQAIEHIDLTVMG
ncbi:MAG: dihydrolipoamide acetyltransferase family protein [Propionibacteriaceae bacterium]|nr:dihydrolipoamide acetyltransferase family protein [Propionibacteriaceae bacterium]